MRKTAVLLAALMLCAALCACNDDSEKKSGSESTASSKAESSASETESSKSDTSKSESSKTESSKTESSKAESSKGDSSETESSKSSEESKTASTASSKIKHTLKDYVKQVKKSGLSDNDTMKIDVYAEDNTFVYAFTYKTQIEEDKLASVKKSLESSLESSSDTYTGVIDEIHDYTGLDAEVKVIYKNADGKTIAEKTFTK